MSDIPAITLARFWSKVSVTKSPLEYWVWNGRTNPGGYGTFRVGNTMVLAHRFSFLHFNGKFEDENHQVRHRCDNPVCVNPNHLLEGTAAENIRDMMERGRWRPAQDPERRSQSKLTWEKVREIRKRCSMGESNRSIAPDFGVSHAQISMIRLNKCWRELPRIKPAVGADVGKVRYAMPEMREA